MANRFILPFADVGNGISPEDGAQLFFFDTGTSNKRSTFSDQAGITKNANPVESNQKGVFPDIYLDGSYKVVLKDKNGVQIWVADPVFDIISSDTTTTITSLKAILGQADNEVVTVLGHTEVGDGGGGVFRFDASSSATDDNGVIIQPTTGTGRWLRTDFEDQNEVYIEWWGAISFTTKVAALAGLDNKVAIDSAIATFKHVIASDGYYGSTGGHVMLADAQTFEGVGRRNYTNDAIDPLVESGTVFVRISGSAPFFKRSNADNTQLRNMTIDNDGITAVGVEDTVCFNSIMYNVMIRGCGSLNNDTTGLFLDRNNICTYEMVEFVDNFTHIRFLGTSFAATNLNLTFRDCILGQVAGGTLGTGFGMLVLAGVNFFFYNFSMDDHSPIRVRPVVGDAIDNMQFFGVGFENDQTGSSPHTKLFDFDNNVGSGVRNIHLRGVRFISSQTDNNQSIFRFRKCQNVSITDLHIEDKTELARNIIELDATNQWAVKNVFYINTQTNTTIDMDIIDCVTASSDNGVVSNIVFSGPQTTGKLKFFSNALMIEITNCAISFNGTSDNVNVKGASGDVSLTNLNTFWQERSGGVTFQRPENATTAVNNFGLVPSVNGTPTGVPSRTYTGAFPMQYDRSGKKLWIYDSGWIGVVLA